MESLDRRLQVFEVQTEVGLNLVLPVDVLLNAFELVPLLVVDAAEPLQLPVRLRMLDAA